MKYKGVISTLESLEAAINTVQYLGVSKLVKKSDNMVLGYGLDHLGSVNYNHGSNKQIRSNISGTTNLEYRQIRSNVPVTHELHLSHESKYLSSINIHVPNQDICMLITKGDIRVIIYEDKYYFELATISIIGDIGKVGLLRIIDNKHVLYLQSIPDESVQVIIDCLNR